MTLSPILLLRLGLTSKFSNPAFHLFIRPIGLSLKIGILSFFEERLLIIE
jgi:hypothetical protein